MPLQEKLIKLAYENPELRKDLLPLLKGASALRSGHTSSTWKKVFKEALEDRKEEIELMWNKMNKMALRVSADLDGLAFGGADSQESEQLEVIEAEINKAMVILRKSIFELGELSRRL